MASLDLSGGASSSSAGVTPQAIAVGEDGLGRATLTDEERASLQAQLALLAAQLSEIAYEEPVPMHLPAPPEVPPAEHARSQSQPQQPQSQQLHHPNSSQPQQPPRLPPVITQASSMHAVLMDVNQFPDNNPSTLVGVFQVRAQTRTPPRPSTPSQPPPPQPAVQLLPTPASQHPTHEPAFQPTVAAEAEESPAVRPIVAAEAPKRSAAAPDEESDEDEDMEMVDVDSFIQGLRT
ncbi:uncharacterized protein PHACADRAFT_262322 [Phanerochaete carnosa HHB-10118-sp]|uniref:Uncharacterized protein n=1 Tax=Phanerochaete carnosa (strain HHB-10118-sp) TaxID=650164 RepID=K5UQ17_PHACS|nr:uncharacterized protein PHACADRAFT_262322 [Phanerochaete carnosa HHB-10118-sp]EKM51911.1 hypothetical protein PHACADRAFT_262322 [Phanerochaete carnosa HHB-10118-sp]